MATSMSFLVAPYLLLTACESSFYTMAFIEDLEAVQTALRKNEQVAIDVRHFELPQLDDTCVCTGSLLSSVSFSFATIIITYPFQCLSVPCFTLRSAFSSSRCSSPSCVL